MASLLYNNLILLLIFMAVLKINTTFFKINTKIFNFFLLYHGCFTLLYLFIFTGKAADYYTYIHLVGIRDEHDYIGAYSFLSSNFVYQIIIFLKLIFINDFNIIVIFSLISFFGIIIFIQNLIKLGIDKKIAYIIFLIPGIHFWTSIIGKDCLILFFLACFFYFYIDKKIIYSIIFIIPVFLIRPHIGIIFFMSLLFNEFILKTGKQKFIYLFIFFVGIFIFFSLPQIQSLFFNNNNMISNNIILKILSELNSQAGKFLNTGTGYESSSLYINMFNYILFPLEFLVKSNSFSINIFILIEILTIIFLSTLIMSHNKEFEIDKRIIYFLLTCIFVYLIIIPQTFFNFGLNARQKWMIIPFLIYLSFLLKNLFVRIKKI